jgi:hypothetical protein
VQGTFSAINEAVYVRFYATRYFSVSAFPVGVQPRHFDFRIVDDLTGREMTATQNNFMLSLDPGYYCLKVFNADGTQGAPYRVDISEIPKGFIPPTTKPGAFFLAQLELGNLTQNGYYAETRYVRFLNNNNPNIPLQLEPAHEYVLRDWLSGAKREQWYKFSLDAQRTVEVRLYNLYLGANFSLETEGGTIVAAGVPGGSPLTPLLATQVFKGALPASTYYLRVSYANVGSPGTTFGLWLRAN